MKKVIFMFGILAILTSCRDNSNSQVTVKDYSENQNPVTVTPKTANLGDNLNLQALGEMVRASTSAQDIEDKLNSNGSINNLDLDNDGNIDYIKVTEYGNGNNRGFSFTVDLPNNETQEVATIEVNKGGDKVNMNIQGNQQLYGNNGYYQSHYSLSDMLIMSYFLSPHIIYHSPYHYGYYPRYYRPYRCVPVHTYSTRVVKTVRYSSFKPSSRPTVSRISSPNANRNSHSIVSRANGISNPNRSQRAFTKTSVNNSRPSTNGFGSSNRNSTRSSYSSPKRSSSSFGSSSRSSSSRR